MIILYVFLQNKRDIFLYILALQLMLSRALPLTSQTHLQTRPGHPVSFSISLFAVSAEDGTAASPSHVCT